VTVVKPLLRVLAVLAWFGLAGYAVVMGAKKELADREAAVSRANEQRFRDFLGGDTGEVQVVRCNGREVELLNIKTGRGVYWATNEPMPCERGERWVVAVDGGRLKFLNRK
jgi:hypothetical protein